jgi:hypothetical protein
MRPDAADPADWGTPPGRSDRDIETADDARVQGAGRGVDGSRDHEFHRRHGDCGGHARRPSSN